MMHNNRCIIQRGKENLPLKSWNSREIFHQKDVQCMQNFQFIDEIKVLKLQIFFFQTPVIITLSWHSMFPVDTALSVLMLLRYVSSQVKTTLQRDILSMCQDSAVSVVLHILPEGTYTRLLSEDLPCFC